MKLKSGRPFPVSLAGLLQEWRGSADHLIIVKPSLGLANRMRVIASGLWLKNKLKGNLVVVWVPEEEMNCPYEQVLEIDGHFRLIEEKRLFKHVKATNQRNPAKAVVAHLLNKYRGVDYCIKEHDFHRLIWSGKLDVLEAARKNKIIYIQTIHAFGDDDSTYKSLRPIRQIREQVDLVSKAFTKATVGIHIRRTDNALSIQNSPLTSFIERMRQELAANPETNFFLATDDPEVEREIVGLFGSRIITYKKERSRRTIKGIQDAAVDLYCLSRTGKIIGSYWSSFSETASKINQVDLEIIKNPGV